MMWWACPPVLNSVNVSAKIWGSPTALHTCNLLFLIFNFHLSISRHFSTLCPTTAHLTFGASTALEYIFGNKIDSLFQTFLNFGKRRRKGGKIGANLLGFFTFAYKNRAGTMEFRHA